MYLGIDLGTTNVKALLCDEEAVLARGSAPVGLKTRPDGTAEQDLEEITAAARKAVAGAVAGRGKDCVAAVGVSSQGGAMQILDGSGRPSGPVISWMDGRGLPFDQALTQELGPAWLKAHTGHGCSGMTLGQIVRCREQGRLPPSFGVGYVGDLVVERLCGRRAHDATSLSLAMLYNPALNAADPEVLQRIGVSETQLPSLLPATQPAGLLDARASEYWGLPAGIPVSPAFHDQYAAALGCGAVNAGDVMFGAGTAWVLLAVSDCLPDPGVFEAYDCRHPAGGHYGHLLSMVNGGSAMAWALRLVGREDSPAAELERIILDVPAGCEGLTFWPLLVPARLPGAAADLDGRLDGLRAGHTAAHLLRAVEEGLACELRRHLDLLGSAGISPDRLIMAGRAAEGRTAPSIVADLSGLPVVCEPEPDVSALGAASVARALAGAQSSLEDALIQPRSERKVVRPSADREVPDNLYERYRQRFSAGARS